MEGSVWKCNKRRGFFSKMIKRWEVPLLNIGKGRGFWAKWPLSSSSLHGRTGEGPSGAGGDRFGRSAPRRRPGVEGKGGGGSAGLIPGLTLCRGGAWRPGHGGQQWRGVSERPRRCRAAERGRGVAARFEVVGVVLGGALRGRSPASPCAGVEHGGPATVASSGGWGR